MTTNIDQQIHSDSMTSTFSDTQMGYNGYANYATWNAALWVLNDEFLYNTAKACVTFCGENETPWAKFVRCMMEGQIGRYLGGTGDGVAWDCPEIDTHQMEELMADLRSGY
jgi:hypothetical protein